MRTIFIRIFVALAAFAVGVSAAGVLRTRTERVTVNEYAWKTLSLPDAPSLTSPTDCNDSYKTSEPLIPAEDRAVLTAEDFISRNGYTRLPGDAAAPSHEALETSEDADEILTGRHDTLEPKAYGFTYGRRGKKGYTVVFRYTKRMGGAAMKTGRAVTMDENFQNLRVEHSDFFLDKVSKKVSR